ncbi:unnamed protein product [Ixodes hexagonus]
MTYVTMKKLRQQNIVHTRGFFLRYLMHRIVRLAPLLVLATLLVVPLFPQSGQGPTWELEVNKFLSGCSRNWWWNVLHVNNFLGRKEQARTSKKRFLYLQLQKKANDPIENFINCCMEHTWFFALTMQCTTAAVIVIPVLYHRPAAGRLFVVMAILTSMALTFALTLLYDLGPTWMLREYRPGGLELPGTEMSAAYGATSRILWAVSLSWMAVACASGHGGWLNELLSFKCWLPLSRLLYSLYMISPLVIVYSNGVREHSYYLSYDAMSYVLLHHMVLSLLAATALSVSLELPLIKMAALVSTRLESNRAAKLDEPAIPVPRIERHWLDRDFENPAFAKEKP